MPTIKVRVEGKIAENLTPEVELVCGNEDYEVEFEFDESWAGANFKTGLFIRNGELIAKPFDGNVCPVPRIDNATLLAVGVKSSDGRLFTTTPAYVNCLKSASDLATNKIPAPTQDVYDEIIALINKYIGQGGGGEIPNLDEYVKNTDYATNSRGGVFKIFNDLSGLKIDNLGFLSLAFANNTDIEYRHARALSSASIDEIMRVGVTTNTKTLSASEQLKAQKWLGVDDRFATINLTLEQSGLLKKYKQPIEQEYTERVTAGGAPAQLSSNSNSTS